MRNRAAACWMPLVIARTRFTPADVSSRSRSRQPTSIAMAMPINTKMAIRSGEKVVRLMPVFSDMTRRTLKFSSLLSITGRLQSIACRRYGSMSTSLRGRQERLPTED
jgi:hypothetical protein